MGFFDKVLGAATLGLAGDDEWVNTATDTLGLTNNKNTEAANRANIAEAQKNRDFQERMSNTAYQRAMKDMKDANLNPMLAFTQGGASQPSGSQATVQAQTKAPLAQMALSAYTGIKGAQSQSAQSDAATLNATSGAAVNQSKIAQIAADTDRQQQQTNLLKEQQLTERFRRGEIDAKTRHLQKDIEQEPNAPIYRSLKRDTIDVAKKTGNILEHGARSIQQTFENSEQMLKNKMRQINTPAKQDFFKNTKREYKK